MRGTPSASEYEDLPHELSNGFRVRAPQWRRYRRIRLASRTMGYDRTRQLSYRHEVTLRKRLEVAFEPRRFVRQLTQLIPVLGIREGNEVAALVARN